MIDYRMEVTLESDATFGRGDGVAGLVDVEVEHDPETGLPFIRGKTLRGLLVEECANLLYGLRAAKAASYAQAQTAANHLFGQPGSQIDNTSALFVGAATFPSDFQDAVRYEIQYGSADPKVTPHEILESLTTIRRRTAIDSLTGTAEENTLRAMRVVIRGVILEARFTVNHSSDPNEKECEVALLSACAQSVRRGGLGRNRGAGKLRCRLLDKNCNEVNADGLWKENAA